MLTFIEGVAREEGFYKSSSRAQRNNNPGNLNFEVWQKPFGAVLETHTEPRFAAFATEQGGWEAMRNLILREYIGLTFAQALAKWAPSSDGNDGRAYLANVCKWTGKTPGTILTAANMG